MWRWEPKYLPVKTCSGKCAQILPGPGTGSRILTLSRGAGYSILQFLLAWPRPWAAPACRYLSAAPRECLGLVLS